MSAFIITLVQNSAGSRPGLCLNVIIPAEYIYVRSMRIYLAFHACKTRATEYAGVRRVSCGAISLQSHVISELRIAWCRRCKGRRHGNCLPVQSCFRWSRRTNQTNTTVNDFIQCAVLPRYHWHYTPDMAMGWVDPWVGLGWVEFGQIWMIAQQHW